MLIYRPVKTNRITQEFGEDNVCTQIMDSGQAYVPYKTINMPSNGVCPTGYASLYKTLGVDGHTGTDFACNYKEPVHFNVKAEDQDGNPMKWEILKTSSVTAGYGVMVRSLKPIPLEESPVAVGNSMDLIGRQYTQLGGAVHHMFYFGHLAEPSFLKDRQIITVGDKIGLAGTTGASTGVHVHHDRRICGTNDGAPFMYLDGDSDFKGRLPINNYYVNKFVLERTMKPTQPNDSKQLRELQLQVIALSKQAIYLLRAIIANKAKQS